MKKLHASADYNVNMNLCCGQMISNCPDTYSKFLVSTVNTIRIRTLHQIWIHTLIKMRAVSSSLLRLFAMCLLKIAFVCSTPPFLTNTPGREWKMVGYLDMTDPSQQCPDSWLKIASPRSSCGKRTMQTCDSLSIPTAGASYQKVCGRFRGYQIGTTDAFYDVLHLGVNIETHFADGVIVTYGSPGRRQHVYSYVAALWESVGGTICPCAGGAAPPLFVGSDYYCESGNPVQEYHPTSMYSSDVLWDRQQCGGNETTCCDPPDIPWFCKTFSTQISEDLEVRICTDESSVDNENVAIESFELYIQGEISGAIG